MHSKKKYQLVESNEKQSGLETYNRANISWFLIITRSFLGLFLVILITFMVLRNGRSLTPETARNEQSSSPSASVTVNTQVQNAIKNLAGNYLYDRCAGKYIYVLDLPSEFNTDLLENCSTLSPFIDACKLIANSGIGLRLNVSDETVFSGSNWFASDQFSLEVIFHNRMKQYKCLTNNYSKASAVFVPYYSGLDVGRYLFNLNATLRDETSLKLVKYIKQKPEWKRYGGRDHFLIVGRITWDFRRKSENTSTPDGWGNRLLCLPEIKNMTSLSLEASPMSKSEIGIPYPTYFHPSSGNEVQIWQEKMRQRKRPYLFSFAGAPRPNMRHSIRNLLIEQCLAAKGNNCKYVHTKLDVKPETVMSLLQMSDFCLQPPGDSLTRKSIFDTIIAGCIPVLFHPGSAWTQYIWHLPKDHSSYSVFIPMEELQNGKVSIEKRLLEIPKNKVTTMRAEVIKLIPRIVYANPNSKVDHLEDAFDVAVKGILTRVKRIKMEMEGGKIRSFKTVPDH